MNRTALIAALAAGALLAPAAGAAAKKPDAAKGKAKAEQVAKAKGKDNAKAKKVKKVKKAKKVKVVSYTLSGVYQGEGTVLVKRGNGAARKARLFGALLELDWSQARVVVDDVNGDGVEDIDDVQNGDRVLVQFRAPSVLSGDATYKARKLVDQTNPPVEDEEDETFEDGDDAGVDEPADEELVEDGDEVAEDELGDDLGVEDLSADETGDGQ